ncbi:MAG: heparinase II/III family protein [Balneolales bacterium]
MKSIITTASVMMLLMILTMSCSTSNPGNGLTDQSSSNEDYRLDNPMSVEYLETHLEKQTPRLVLNPERERRLRNKLESDPVVQAYYESLKADAARIMQEPLLEHNIYDGKRLLRISREMVKRMGILGMVYHIGNDPDVLARINEELIAVSNFVDWNPSHFLDVGEMSLAFSLALDWAGQDLPASTVDLAETALIEKGILPSFEGRHGWITNTNNWNQVCNGGMIAAAITIAERDPELAARTISRSLDGMPYALKEYGPDGIYPEGPTYWDYGTMYSVITSSMLTSAFGTDFGLAGFPGFLESANFRMMVVGPSGEFFNFFDAGSNLTSDNRGRGDHTVAWFNRGNGVVNLTWFAAHTGNSLYYDSSYFTEQGENRRNSRFDGPAMVWLSEYEPKDHKPLPLIWSGQSKNPLAIFRGGENDPENNPEQFYLGAKGGQGTISHGHLDGGSFVFDLDGVRWSIDPGAQSYAAIEQTGFNLWGRGQDDDRWTLQAYNNYGHSTLTVNNALHKASGFVPLTGFNDGSNGENPEASFDLSDIFEGHLQSATRRFIKEDDRSIFIEDIIVPSESTEVVTWQMVTTAEVLPVRGGALLRQDGKELSLEILSPADVQVSVVSLNPPPMELDKQIDNFKRIEIRVPAWRFDGREGRINVRLTGN